MRGWREVVERIAATRPEVVERIGARTWGWQWLGFGRLEGRWLQALGQTLAPALAQDGGLEDFEAVVEDAVAIVAARGGGLTENSYVARFLAVEKDLPAEISRVFAAAPALLENLSSDRRLAVRAYMLAGWSVERVVQAEIGAADALVRDQACAAALVELLRVLATRKHPEAEHVFRALPEASRALGTTEPGPVLELVSRVSGTRWWEDEQLDRNQAIRSAASRLAGSVPNRGAVLARLLPYWAWLAPLPPAVVLSSADEVERLLSAFARVDGIDWGGEERAKGLRREIPEVVAPAARLVGSVGDLIALAEALPAILGRLPVVDPDEPNTWLHSFDLSAWRGQAARASRIGDLVAAVS